MNKNLIEISGFDDFFVYPRIAPPSTDLLRRVFHSSIFLSVFYENEYHGMSGVYLGGIRNTVVTASHGFGTDTRGRTKPQIKSLQSVYAQRLCWNKGVIELSEAVTPQGIVFLNHLDIALVELPEPLPIQPPDLRNADTLVTGESLITANFQPIDDLTPRYTVLSGDYVDPKDYLGVRMINDKVESGQDQTLSDIRSVICDDHGHNFVCGESGWNTDYRLRPGGSGGGVFDYDFKLVGISRGVKVLPSYGFEYGQEIIFEGFDNYFCKVCRLFPPTFKIK